MKSELELIKVQGDHSLDFGDYTLKEKTKQDGFKFQGDIYKIKTFSEITKLEKNGMLVYESVPGTKVEDFQVTEDGVTFKVFSNVDVQLTLELEEECEYLVYVDQNKIGEMKTNLSGKLSIGVELNENSGALISVKKA